MFVRLNAEAFGIRLSSGAERGQGQEAQGGAARVGTKRRSAGGAAGFDAAGRGARPWNAHLPAPSKSAPDLSGTAAARPASSHVRVNCPGSGVFDATGTVMSIMQPW